MKLLFFCHAISGGGAERVLSVLANSFVLSHSVVIATNTSVPFAYNLKKNIKVVELYRGRITASGKFGRIKNAIKLRSNIRKIAKQESPDIIVAFMGSLGATVVFSTFGLGIPIVISEHTTLTRKLGLAVKIKRMLSYPLASCVTVLTRSDFSQFKKKYKNLVRMPNPIELQEVDITLDRRNVVLAVGRIEQWHVKGFDLLIQCWSRIYKLFPEWKLEIAGKYDKESLSILMNKINHEGCSNIEFLGFRKDVTELMKTSEIFCLSSRVEGLPMTLIEAMNAGCCCISFDIKTGPNEIIKNERSGFLIKEQDVNEMANKLKQLMSDANLRAKLRKNTRQSLNQYDLRRVLQRWEVLFKKIQK